MLAALCSAAWLVSLAAVMEAPWAISVARSFEVRLPMMAFMRGMMR